MFIDICAKLGLIRSTPDWSTYDTDDVAAGLQVLLVAAGHGWEGCIGLAGWAGMAGMNRGSPPAPDQVSWPPLLQNFLICIEMFMAAVAHAHAFPPRVSSRAVVHVSQTIMSQS